MCLAVPLQLIEINGNSAVGEAMGSHRREGFFRRFGYMLDTLTVIGG